MSVSFMWEVMSDTNRSFNAGTSSDEDALAKTFGNTVSIKDIPVLRAMHRALRSEKSLWSEIADTLERIQGDDYDKDVTLRIWTQY